jgi:PAS domain S-box-containing protein
MGVGLYELSGHTLWTALNATPVNIVLADATQPERPLVFVNRSFEATTGYTAERVIGTNCKFLQGPDTSPDAVDAIRSALQENRAIEIEILNYKACGQPFWNLLNITPVFAPDGSVRSFIGIQSDVTEKKRLASQNEQRMRAEALGILAGGLAHEINNLLQPMVTFPELIRDVVPSHVQDAHDGLDLIESHAKAAKSIVQQILGYARSEAADLQKICLGRKITELVEDAKRGIPDTITLSLSTPKLADVDLAVRIDEAGLRTLVSNMVKNAADAIGDQPGTILIELYRNGPDIHIVFSDDGCGMTPTNLSRIFSPFFTTKPVGQGTGLGLALIDADVRRWGGSILSSSTPGKGTRFDVVVPAFTSPQENKPSLAQVA